MNYEKYKLFFRSLHLLISLLPFLFFTSGFVLLLPFLVPIYYMIMFSANCAHAVMEIQNTYEPVDQNTHIPQAKDYIFLSEGSSKKEDKEFERSFVKLKDFIRVAEKGGSGEYPTDFSESGYKRDDGTMIHSKAPIDWGINEYYNFGDYADLSKRKESGQQIALWLEYQQRVNKTKYIDYSSATSNHNIKSTDWTFNASGAKWYKDFCKDHNVPHTDDNSKALRDFIRNQTK